MGEQNHVYPCNGILVTGRKKCSIDIFCNIDKPGKYYAQRQRPDTKGHTPCDPMCKRSLELSDAKTESGRRLGNWCLMDGVSVGGGWQWLHNLINVL